MWLCGCQGSDVDLWRSFVSLSYIDLSSEGIVFVLSQAVVIIIILVGVGSGAVGSMRNLVEIEVCLFVVGCWGGSS